MNSYQLRLRRWHALICAAQILFALGAQASQPDDSSFMVTEVAGGVFVHTGGHFGLDHAGRGDSANIGFIVGDTCVAVIDTGGALATGRALKWAIKQHTNVPVCYVINTHVHFDHVLGNQAFVGPNVQFVGHTNLAIAMEANREFFVEQFGAEIDGAGVDVIIAPTRAVEDELTLELGNRRILLQAQATAHTNADLSIFDEQTQTLWTGDLVFMERMPILDGSLKGWLKWFDRTRERDIARIVPGHGPAFAAWPAGAQTQKNYLNALLEDGRKAVRDGVFLEDALETMSRDAAASWVLNERHSRNVSKAFRELEWE